MNHGPIVFLIAFIALGISWFGMILVPQSQIGQLQPTNTVGPVTTTYPIGSSGLARQGLEVYRAQGCAYCHSQQVRQSGAVFDVVLNEAGTNEAAVINTLVGAKVATSEAQARQLLSELPKAITRATIRPQSESEVKALRAAGAKADLWILPVGPDIARGYGKRHSVAQDFLYDSTVMPGSIRIGPDLANVGARLSDPNWHLRHLYSPSAEVKGSPMPPYRYLFEKRKITHGISADALVFPVEAGIPAGYEIVPRPEAKALVAYLTSLRVEAPLFEAPFTIPAPPPQPGTNAPGSDTNAPAAASTNATAPGTGTNAPASTNQSGK
jgi:cbb3-type cytochrome oxidase cytochrome c subunit